MNHEKKRIISFVLAVTMLVTSANLNTIMPHAIAEDELVTENVVTDTEIITTSEMNNYGYDMYTQTWSYPGLYNSY